LAFAALLGFGLVALGPSPVQAGHSLDISTGSHGGSHGRLGVTSAHGYGSHHGARSHYRSHYRRHYRPHYRRYSRPHYRRHSRFGHGSGYGSAIAVFFGSGAFSYGHYDSYSYKGKRRVRYLPIHRLVAGVRAGTFACYHRTAKRLRLSPHRLKRLYAAGRGDAIRCYAIH
jgi:hypothetical protein